ncbi:MAG: outer membrane porin, OprD family [Dechloromonas sp.]|uniref:OprD family outer membrane porin n=1 Tax=Azonexaceae TaxID=2008795 RepID=UPI001CF884AA|nr:MULTISPECIES: OprD family outer membrane porin [Azonexaceae]MBT9520309.1 outer membrane porin, OprD family [Dechloromonas sp.]UCV21203.1 OprD family outer membrane porin [Ferribacterium limneticum]
MSNRIKRNLLHALIAGLMLPVAAFAAEGEHKLELKARAVYWNDDSLVYPTSTTPSPKASSYEQSALGVQINYASPYWASFIGVDASLYGVAKIGDSGTPTSNLVDVGNNGQLEDSYVTAGQALVKLKYQDIAQLKVGRQIQNSLLLKSTATRAVPDTYSGASALVKPIDGLTIYGAIYDQWRARSTGEFEKFKTEATAVGVANEIDYISIFGASYANGPLLVTAEYLNSKNYLSKFGLVGAYTIPFDKNSLKISGGLFTSRDAGSLFVCSAEKELDCTGTSRLTNDGLGVYIDGEWKVSNFTLGAAIAKFDGFWIEDNFAVDATKTGSLTQDHGSNPFPTSAGLGPDLSNRDELVGSIRLAYDFKEYVPGLKAGFKYARGTGAKSSNRENLAKGSENYREFDLQYAIPFVKNLSARYIYMNYDSHVENGSTTATIKGMPRQEWEQHRFYIDYSYQF